MTIGKELQKQRRAKQLSLEAVSQTLRVDQATLQKIEADDFQGLNPVMVRSCIRQYASLLGLDGAQLLDQFTEPAAAGKDIPAAKPTIPVKEKVTEVRAANPAPVKEASPAGKAKAKEILDKSKVPHGFKAIFKFFDAINLDKLLKIGIWVILGLAVVGSVAGGFNALASKPTSISHSSSSSSSSSPSSSSSSKPAQDDSAKPDENKPSHDDQQSQPSQSQSQSKEEQVSSSSEASSSSSVASSSSQEQSSQASSSSSQSSTDTTTDTNE